MKELLRQSGGEETALAANIAELLSGFPEIVAVVVDTNQNARDAVAAGFAHRSAVVRAAFAAAVRLLVTRVEWAEYVRPMGAAVEAVTGANPVPLAADAADKAAKASLPPQPRVAWRSATKGWESMGMGVKVATLIKYLLQFPELRDRLETTHRKIGLKVFIDAAMATKVGRCKLNPVEPRVTGARAKAWCHLIHAEASLSLSL